MKTSLLLMSLMANMKNKFNKNIKCDVNIRTGLFRVSVSNVYFTNFINKAVCKVSQSNRVSKSQDTATKTKHCLLQVTLSDTDNKIIEPAHEIMVLIT